MKDCHGSAVYWYMNNNTRNGIDGFKRMAMGDYMGSRSYFGSCCGCRAQFMSTHEVVYVPTSEVRAANKFYHGPACEHCARRALASALIAAGAV